jgi:integrase
MEVLQDQDRRAVRRSQSVDGANRREWIGTGSIRFGLSGDAQAGFDVPMTPRVSELLKNLPRNHRWVLTASPSAKYPKGGNQISERRLLKSLKRVLTKLGLKGHLHTFRHSFISHALMAGVPEAVVRSWVGHVDRDILKLYTHIADADSQSAMKRLAEAQDILNSNHEEQTDDSKE